MERPYKLRQTAQRLRGLDTTPFQPFRFLDLPAEVRNTIYELTVISAGVIEPLRVFVCRELQDLGVPRGGSDQKQPNITLVCRRIRQEALPVYYSQNTFSLSKRPSWLYCWPYRNVNLPITAFQKIGEQNLKALRSISVRIASADSRQWLFQYYQIVVKLSIDSSNLEVFSSDILYKDSAKTLVEFIHEYAGSAENDDFNGLHLIRVVTGMTTMVLKESTNPVRDEQAVKTAFGYRLE